MVISCYSCLAAVLHRDDDRHWPKVAPSPNTIHDSANLAMSALQSSRLSSPAACCRKIRKPRSWSNSLHRTLHLLLHLLRLAMCTIADRVAHARLAPFSL